MILINNFRNFWKVFTRITLAIMTASKQTFTATILAATLLFSVSYSALATITVVSDWRMGESESRPSSFINATTAIDIVGSNNLTFQGAATYSSDVSVAATAHTGSFVSVNLLSGSYASNGIVSTVTSNFGIEAWVKPAFERRDGQRISRI